MGLFGKNLFTLNCVDIDSILRKVHKELVIMIEEPRDIEKCHKHNHDEQKKKERDIINFLVS